MKLSILSTGVPQQKGRLTGALLQVSKSQFRNPQTALSRIVPMSLLSVIGTVVITAEIPAGCTFQMVYTVLISSPMKGYTCDQKKFDVLHRLNFGKRTLDRCRLRLQLESSVCEPRQVWIEDNVHLQTLITPVFLGRWSANHELVFYPDQSAEKPDGSTSYLEVKS